MTSGEAVDVAAVQGTEHGDGGVPASGVLVAFVEAVLGSDDEALQAARHALTAELDDERMVDTAGVISAFQMMNRIANATGTPLDEPLVAQTAGIVPQIGVSKFASAPAATTLDPN